jgi:succinoglycan biosynthesis transport protein ExoP
MSSRERAQPGAVGAEPSPGAALPRGEGSTGIDALLSLWRSRRRLILSVAAVGTALAVVAGLQLQPRFTATAAVVIAPRQSNIVGVDAVLSSLSADPATVETQIKLIRSRDHAARVVRALELQGDAELDPRDRAGGDLAFTVADPWRALVRWLPGDWLIATGLAEEQAGRLPAEPRAHLDRVLDAFTDRLTVSRDGRSHVINVSFTSTDPAKAALIANEAAELYIEDQLAAKRSATTKASAWLWERIEALRAELEASEQAVAQYRAEHDLVEDDRISLNQQELAGLQRELIVAEAELAGRRARLDLINQLRTRGEGMKSLPEVMASPHIADLWRQETELQRVEAELRTVYGDNHPRMRSLLADKANLVDKVEVAIGRIVGNLEHETSVIEGRIAALQEHLELAKDTNTQSRAAGVRLGELERQAGANRQMYEMLLQRYKETREQEQIVEADAQIVVRATPPIAPSSPGVPFFAAFGFVGSSLLGVLLALLADRFDHGLRDAKQLHALFGLPCLATCPRLPRSVVGRGKAAHDYLIERPRSRYAESIRSLQLAMRGARGDGLPQVMQVTSSIPDEGKTTLAFSLATSLAQTGARVLLFELDLRRPCIMKRSWTGSDGPLGPTPLFSELRHDERTGVDLILVGQAPSNPQAVLTSEDLAGAMRRLRRRYDHIVVDSAPLLGLSDSKFLIDLVDAIVLAVRWQSTSSDLVREALDELRMVSAPLLGAVITQVDFDRQARYGYGGAARYSRKYRGYYVD